MSPPALLSQEAKSRLKDEIESYGPTVEEIDQPRKYNALYAHQLKAVFSKKYVVASVGGSGAGKTYMAPIFIYNKIRERPYSRSLAIGLSYKKHVERTIVHELIEFFKGHKIYYDYNATKAMFTLAEGQEILLGSADNPNSLEGTHLDGVVWIDEAGQMPRLAWDVAQRRSGLHKDNPKSPTQILLTTVPYFYNWVKDIYDQWLKGDPDTDWIPCKTMDNLDYSTSMIERLKRTLRPDKYKVYVEGEWAKPHGLIFPDIEDSHLVAEPFAIPDEWPAFAGHDFGINNPTTGVWGRLSPDDILYIVAEYEVPDLPVEEHVVVWKGLGLDAIDYAWGDPTSPGLIMTAQGMGYPMDAGENAVNYGIDTVYTRMKTGRLKVFRGLRTILDYKNQYVWAEDPLNEDRLLDKPKKPQPSEHMMDALRYLCVGLQHYSTGSTAVVSYAKSHGISAFVPKITR